MTRTQVGFLAVGLALVAVAVVYGLSTGHLRANHPDPRRFSVWGVDVSHHQGHVDWPQLAASEHMRFAYIKATEGGDWIDRRFHTNWSEARAAGLRVGAYHFFSFCRPVLDQVEHVLSIVPDAADSLPIAVDVEFGGNCRTTLSRVELRRALDLFLLELERARGRRPVLYVTPEAYSAFVEGSSVDAHLWLRNIWTEPRGESRGHWRFWQFANRGRLRGVATHVDLNVFAGTLEELEAL